MKSVAQKLEHKNIHILINNTGGPAGGPITSAQSQDFEKAFQMHVVCNQILSKAVVDSMKKACYGRIERFLPGKNPINGLAHPTLLGRSVTKRWPTNWDNMACQSIMCCRLRTPTV